MSWVLPTYGRPARCQEALDAIMAAGVSTPGVVIVDGDPDVAYATLRLPQGWRLEIHPENLGLCGVLNGYLTEHPDLEWYGLLTDDALVKTPDWDTELVKSAGVYGVASCSDGWRPGERIAGAVVFGGGLLRAWGWWCAPGLWHTYADDVWEQIVRSLGNWRYRGDITVEHRHVFNAKAEADATHERSYSRINDDRLQFGRLLDTEIPEAIERAARVMGTKVPEVERIRMRRDRAKSRSVLICTPVHDRTSWQYTKALVETSQLLSQYGIRHRAQFVIGSSNLPRARNELAQLFLDSDADDLLFIDSDMGWAAGAVMRLISSDKEVLAAVGRKKVETAFNDAASWCFKMLPGQLHIDDMGMVEVECVGTGFMKISRSALEKIAENGPRDLKLPPYYRFFRFNEADGGEDYEFCRLWRSIGGKVWVDPDVELEHAGEKSYKGRLGDLMVAAPPREIAPVLEAAE